MKNKILAVLTAAAIGVMGFVPVIKTQAAAVSRTCHLCGEESIADQVIDYRYVQIMPDDDPEPCRHGHSLSADFLFRCDDLVIHYCSDCDIHWETWETDHFVWYCTFDGQYHPF